MKRLRLESCHFQVLAGLGRMKSRSAKLRSELRQQQQLFPKVRMSFLHSTRICASNFDSENLIPNSNSDSEFDSDFYDESGPEPRSKLPAPEFELIPEEELFPGIQAPKRRRKRKSKPKSKPTSKQVHSIIQAVEFAMANRPRRPDSKQMWEESDRRAPAREERRDDRRDDRRDRDRRYRSRSPRESRGQERDYRQRDSREERGGRRDERGGERGSRREGGRDRERGDTGRNSRDKPRDRSRSRDQAKDHSKRDVRSRSPRRDRERDTKKEPVIQKQIPEPIKREDIPVLPVAPVSFKVGGPVQTADPDRMETDEDSIQAPKAKSSKAKKSKAKPVEEDDDIEVEEDDDVAAMQAMMGFGGFGTTHQKKVEGNNVSAVRKEKKSEYRQYMNRQGGFNRPLSPSREV